MLEKENPLMLQVRKLTTYWKKFNFNLESRKKTLKLTNKVYLESLQERIQNHEEELKKLRKEQRKIFKLHVKENRDDSSEEIEEQYITDDESNDYISDEEETSSVNDGKEEQVEPISKRLRSNNIQSKEFTAEEMIDLEAAGAITQDDIAIFRNIY